MLELHTKNCRLDEGQHWQAGRVAQTNRVFAAHKKISQLKHLDFEKYIPHFFTCFADQSKFRACCKGPIGVVGYKWYP